MWPALRAWLARQLGYDEPGEGFDLSFTDQDVVRSLFSEDSGSLLTDSSRSCMREDHLLYNQELDGAPAGLRGLLLKMDDVEPSCGHGSQISVGHLSSLSGYTYGDFSWLGRVAHTPDGSKLPENVFSCFAVFAHGDGAHNELAWCFPANDPNEVHMSHWYDDTMHRSVKRLPIDLSAGYHTYTVRWRPIGLDWLIDNTIVHQVRGEPGRTIPSRPMSIRVILRPKNVPTVYLGRAQLGLLRISYTPVGGRPTPITPAGAEAADRSHLSTQPTTLSPLPPPYGPPPSPLPRQPPSPPHPPPSPPPSPPSPPPRPSPPTPPRPSPPPPPLILPIAPGRGSLTAQLAKPTPRATRKSKPHAPPPAPAPSALTAEEPAMPEELREEAYRAEREEEGEEGEEEEGGAYELPDDERNKILYKSGKHQLARPPHTIQSSSYSVPPLLVHGSQRGGFDLAATPLGPLLSQVVPPALRAHPHAPLWALCGSTSIVLSAALCCCLCRCLCAHDSARRPRRYEPPKGGRRLSESERQALAHSMRWEGEARAAATRTCDSSGRAVGTPPQVTLLKQTPEARRRSYLGGMGSLGRKKHSYGLLESDYESEDDDIT